MFVNYYILMIFGQSYWYNIYLHFLNDTVTFIVVRVFSFNFSKNCPLLREVEFSLISTSGEIFKKTCSGKFRGGGWVWPLTFCWKFLENVISCSLGLVTSPFCMADKVQIWVPFEYFLVSPLIYIRHALIHIDIRISIKTSKWKITKMNLSIFVCTAL